MGTLCEHIIQLKYRLKMYVIPVEFNVFFSLLSLLLLVRLYFNFNPGHYFHRIKNSIIRKNRTFITKRMLITFKSCTLNTVYE